MKGKVARIIKYVLIFLMIAGIVFGTVYELIQKSSSHAAYTHAYVKIGEDWADFEISQWRDYGGEQLQLKLADGTELIVNSVNCVLHNGKLPKGERQ